MNQTTSQLKVTSESAEAVLDAQLRECKWSFHFGDRCLTLSFCGNDPQPVSVDAVTKRMQVSHDSGLYVPMADPSFIVPNNHPHVLFSMSSTALESIAAYPSTRAAASLT